MLSSTLSDCSLETEEKTQDLESESSPSNGLENFDFSEETTELFNSENSNNENSEDSFISSDTTETKEEEDELEIPAFLRRQKN